MAGLSGRRSVGISTFFGDRLAATLLFNARIPLVLFDTGTDLTCPMDESGKNAIPAPRGGTCRITDSRHNQNFHRIPTHAYMG
jgi:hypothetical protein